MTRIAFIASLIVGGALALWLVAGSRNDPAPYEPQIKPIEPASPCPWREADRELTNWYPGATGYSAHDLILSGQRAAMQERLGRPLRPEEMALHTYVVASNHTLLGTVLTRRIKAKHGAIELVVALDRARAVKQLRIQRIREPEDVVNALEQLQLKDRFTGMSVTDDFTIEDAPNPIQESNAPAARQSALDIAREIAVETKTLLVLLEAGAANSVNRHH